jgi:hypothetical protein
LDILQQKIDAYEHHTTPHRPTVNCSY